MEHKMKKLIIDAQSGTETIVEFTAAEKKEFEKTTAETKKISLEIEAETETKAIARQVILDRLGLTADELQVLLG
jgi:hypothetical protein